MKVWKNFILVARNIFTIEIALLGCFWPFLELLWKSLHFAKVCHFGVLFCRFRQTFTSLRKHEISSRNRWSKSTSWNWWNFIFSENNTLILGWNPSQRWNLISSSLNISKWDKPCCLIITYLETVFLFNHSITS